MTPFGDADLCTVPDLRQALNEVTGAGCSHIIVDLDQLSFIDTSTLGVLAQARGRFSATAGTLQVRCRSPHGRRLLSATGLDGMLEDRTKGHGPRRPLIESIVDGYELTVNQTVFPGFPRSTPQPLDRPSTRRSPRPLRALRTTISPRTTGRSGDWS